MIPFFSLFLVLLPLVKCQYEEPKAWQPYSFGYAINDGYGNEQSREEKSDAYGNKRGSYGYTDAHGIYRKVDYVADEHGFRASISTNEPGTGGPDPADVHLEAKPVDHLPPAAAYHAPPVYHAPSYHAPVYHAPSHHEPVHVQPPPPAYHSAPLYTEASHHEPLPYGYRRSAVIPPNVAYSEPRAAYTNYPAPAPYLPLRHKA